MGFEIAYEATDKLLKEALTLDNSAFRQVDTADFETCKSWLEINKDIYTFLLHEGRCVGYINCIALTENCFELFLKGKMKDYLIKPQDILPFKKGKNKALLLSIVVDAKFRDGQAIIELQKGFKRKLNNMKEDGIIIEGLVFDCVSIDGVKYAIQEFGAKYIGDSKMGKTMYVDNVYQNKFVVPKIKLEPLCKRNLKKAGIIQYKIFPTWCGFCDYVDEVKHPNDELPLTYLIKYKRKYVGILGLYEIPKYKNCVWLNWFGVLPKYRNKGIGTSAFFKTLKIARTFNKKEFRLITYKQWNKQAQKLYEKTMQRKEIYDNPNDWQYAIKVGEAQIFSSSLQDKFVSKWNNKFVDLFAEKELHEKSIELMKSLKLI